jgi:hypothetical protein
VKGLGAITCRSEVRFGLGTLNEQIPSSYMQLDQLYLTCTELYSLYMPTIVGIASIGWDL